MDLTKTFRDEQYADALESWRWAGVDGKTPVFTSLFGDVFLLGDGGWWYLDTIEGTITRQWETREAMFEVLNTEAGEDRYLLGALAQAAERAGLELGDDEVYDFMPPPALGGGFKVDNIVVYNFVVSVNVAGQLHEQLRNLPPGAPVTDIKLLDRETPASGEA